MNSMTQHTTFPSVCTTLLPTDETILLSLCSYIIYLIYLSNKQHFMDCCSSFSMNIHFENQLQSFAKQKLTTISFYNLVYVIWLNYIFDWVAVPNGLFLSRTCCSWHTLSKLVLTAKCQYYTE